MKIKKTTIGYLFQLVLMDFLFFPMITTQAAESGGGLQYTPMESVPGFASTNDFPTLVENIYKFGIWSIGIAALLMVTIGGFTYFTSAGNTSKAGDGKKIITDALTGVILALAAYLLFYVINPNLTDVNINIAPANISSTGTGTGTTNETCSPECAAPKICRSGNCVDASEVSDDTKGAASALLSNGNVSWDNNPDCDGVTPRSNITQASQGECSTACNANCRTTGCSDCVSLNTNLLNNLNNVADKYPMTITSLTGGVHGGGSSHYQGNAADVSPSDRSQWSNVVNEFNNKGCNSFCDSNGSHVPCSSASHIHVSC